MRVTVLGGAGYVGAPLCKELLSRGHTVVCIDRLLYGDKGVLVDPDGTRPQGYSFYRLDVREMSWQDYLLADAVVNLAGFSNDPTAQYRPDVNWDLNVAAAAKAANSAAKAKVKRFIYASSASIYHSGEYEVDAELGENSKVKPHWHYSCSKYAGELATMCFAQDMEVVALRKGTVCGPSPRMRYDLMLNTMFRSAMTSLKIKLDGRGMAYRPLVDMVDAVSAYVTAVEAPAAQVAGEVFNVVTENSTVRAYAQTMQAALAPYGYDVKLVDSDQRAISRSYRVSSRKISERTGWLPRGSAQRISKELVEAWLVRRDLPFFTDPTTENMKCIEGAQL